MFLYISNMRTREDAIRTYNLFGETAELPDVVHCETIESRSRLHGWALRPHRHARLHQFLLIVSGGGMAELDGCSIPLAPRMALNIPSGIVHGFAFAPETQGWVITLTSDFLDETLRAGEGLRPSLHRAQPVPLSEDLRRLGERLLTEHAGHGFARAQVLRSLAGVMIGLMARAIAEEAGRADSPREHPLFRRFEKLVEQQFRRRPGIADYAAQLAISPTHLNRIVRQATGRSASRVVADRMLREARRLLTYTDLPVAQVGYELGFSDPAHFSRVFARGTGLAPREFRRRLQRGGNAPPQRNGALAFAPPR